MAISVAQCLLGTLILAGFILVGYALGRSLAGSPSTRKTKSQVEPSTQTSDAQLAALRAEMADLYLILEKLTTTVKRLSSRAGMRDLRERDQEPVVPPVGAPKVELLRHYGMAGKVGPEFARAQMERERS